MAEVAPFSPHDLRRSIATGCAEYLDAPERLIELLLNHVPKDRLIRTYQVGQQAEKLRNLFLKWGILLSMRSLSLIMVLQIMLFRSALERDSFVFS